MRMNLQRAFGIGCLFAAAIAIAAEPDPAVLGCSQ
jgi:hypothetical protein